MSKDTGGPAFPSLNAVCTGLDSGGGERWDTEPSGGMTLRDYFAAKAAATFLQGAVLPTKEARDAGFKMVAVASYELADAMLEARK